MRITIDIQTDNAAFTERYYHQLEEILEKAKQGILAGLDEGKLRDLYGNTVGKFEVKE